MDLVVILFEQLYEIAFSPSGHVIFKLTDELVECVADYCDLNRCVQGGTSITLRVVDKCRSMNKCITLV